MTYSTVIRTETMVIITAKGSSGASRVAGSRSDDESEEPLSSVSNMSIYFSIA